jgi:hypothetical protein
MSKNLLQIIIFRKGLMVISLKSAAVIFWLNMAFISALTATAVSLFAGEVCCCYHYSNGKVGYVLSGILNSE